MVTHYLAESGLNPVLISVVLMLVLSLVRVNVVVALVLSAIVGGQFAGMGLADTISAFESGLGGGASIALSYALLGAFAVAISQSGLTDYLAQTIVKKVTGANHQSQQGLVKGAILLAIIAMAVASQNLVPVHIAFIPILIPPLLGVFNRLNIDRRLIACCLTFGLVTTYMWLPVGFGGIFINQLLHGNLASNGLEIAASELPKAMTLPAMGMLAGLLAAAYFYRKPRNYAALAEVDSARASQTGEIAKPNQLRLLLSFAVIVLALLVQLKTDSIIAGALFGFLALTTSCGIKPKQSQDLFIEGAKMMSLIGFIMIAAAGFAEVMKASGGVPDLVEGASSILGNNKYLAAAVMMAIGLLVTMGIGSSFSTIQIIATIYVPLCAALGFSPLATAALIGSAAAIGDAGSPASDSTLGPTAGLNADGQHDHIFDTVIPTFVFFNLPLLFAGWLAAILL
ncbi:Na+/H+ antiporter family protein [Aliagarivorans marinus]|uniref:Na+/H+ antiporter family protein n=1 Tax=Aliagarivorans marinus TaxID=561965 RepID=UPI000410B35A|nr:SLC13 family permease [Aliagarivorans marinus]